MSEWIFGRAFLLFFYWSKEGFLMGIKLRLKMEMVRDRFRSKWEVVSIPVVKKRFYMSDKICSL